MANREGRNGSDRTDRTGETTGDGTENTPARDGDDTGSDDTDSGRVGSVLARVPESVVPLGAGSLATATLLTLAGTGFIAYSVFVGEFYGYRPYQIYLAGFQFTVATIAQLSGVYFARQRVRWTLVMIAGALGTLTFVALPFSLLALVCLGLGKHHFSSHTPRSVIAAENA